MISVPAVSRRVSRWGSLPLLMVVMVAVGCGRGSSDWIQDLDSSDVALRRAAAERLAEGAPTSPALISALLKATGDPDPEVRRWSCRGLGRHEAREGIPKLEERLKDPSVAVRRSAAFSLQRLVPESTTWRQELIAGMREGDGGLLVAIRRFEPPASWATPVLLDLTKDRRPGIRRLAIEALAEIAPSMEAPRKAFEAAKRDPDDRVRQAGLRALERKSS